MTSSVPSKTLRIGFLTPVLHFEPATAHDVESSFVLRHIFEAPFDVTYGNSGNGINITGTGIERTRVASGR